MELSQAEIDEIKLTIEAALLSSEEPLSISDIKSIFEQDLDGAQIKRALASIEEDWASRSASLVQVASGWRFQVKEKFQSNLDRLEPEKPPKYSRAVLETLAIIAYKQPVTRGDIEQIRGVSVSPNILRSLEARGWIDVVGHRETPGRPELFGTTKGFLDDLGLSSLTALPSLNDLGEILEIDSAGSEQLPLLGEVNSSADGDISDSGEFPDINGPGSSSIN
jgi:segregation and condensation protein B